ncbi:MAG: hypothetical protein J6252_02410 [Clostridia bacterium]|nr:hypothetical protein [Clostridia bacterium]
MDNGLSQKLQSVLSDPEAASRIASVAGALASAGVLPRPESEPAPEREPEAPQTEAKPAASPAPSSAVRDPRVALLYSLKPLLREERRGRIDDLARALSVVSLLGEARKRGE